MAEYVYAAEQTVAYGQNVLLTGSNPCKKGYILHRDGSGVLTLRGIVNNPCANYAKYQVVFNGNIAVPTGGTVGEISIAVAIGGEALATSLAAYTPTVVDAYGNVTSTAIIDVPKGCCVSVAIENNSETAEAILVRNSNLTVNRVG